MRFAQVVERPIPLRLDMGEWPSPRVECRQAEPAGQFLRQQPLSLQEQAAAASRQQSGQALLVGQVCQSFVPVGLQLRLLNNSQTGLDCLHPP